MVLVHGRWQYLWCASEVLWSAASVEVRDVDPCSSKVSRVVGVSEATAMSERDHIGITASACKKVAGSIAQLKHVCTSAHSMEQLEAIVQQEN